MCLEPSKCSLASQRTSSGSVELGGRFPSSATVFSPSKEFLISLCFYCRLTIKALDFLVLKIDFFHTTKRDKEKKNPFSLFHLFSAQLEEQNNYEETPMYLNQSGDTTTLCVIEGTLKGKTMR